MAEESYSAEDLAEWERSVNVLRGGPRADMADERQAYEATANLCSGWGGWMDMPEPISNIVQRAVEAGYLQALADVRDGRVAGLGVLDQG
ncbi:hypothetical protein ETD86_53125 [Nonomuraea turkmeniaca]|uniref:Uncharacterized protein n=1 Tax=Nonomuraea turkmeniaca TaxID=103838 RepID=A0A5S4EUM9_9ACTN|nr:hypothetical protein [Nonomuraea turkmeniaca]TMR05559.1 hypothetical protein ETD86_53125 [Nonomuraea turkmeniaca]